MANDGENSTECQAYSKREHIRITGWLSQLSSTGDLDLSEKYLLSKGANACKKKKRRSSLTGEMLN